MTQRERRLVFGEVAGLYDAHRPDYPPALIDDLCGWAAEDAAGAGAPCALEVGAGTGKATRLLAARGVDVVAIEPSGEMAAYARRTSAGGPGRVELIETDFESAELAGRRFPLVFAGQAWHWVTVPLGYTLARAALIPGGRLAPFWNRPLWDGCALRDALDAVYAAHVPAELGGGPYHPSRATASDAGAGWAAEIEAVDALGESETREYTWSIDYTAADYAALVATHSETRLLDEPTRERFLAGVQLAVEQAGGSFTLPMRTLLCVARAI